MECEKNVGHGESGLQPLVYEIRVRGRLASQHWSRWFDGLTVTQNKQGETILCGPIADQAALFGLLTRLRDLALTLLSVNRVE